MLFVPCGTKRLRKVSSVDCDEHSPACHLGPVASFLLWTPGGACVVMDSPCWTVVDPAQLKAFGKQEGDFRAPLYRPQTALVAKQLFPLSPPSTELLDKPCFWECQKACLFLGRKERLPSPFCPQPYSVEQINMLDADEGSRKPIKAPLSLLSLHSTHHSSDLLSCTEGREVCGNHKT